jgi:biopolymer transport protein ExbB/TolQ
MQTGILLIVSLIELVLFFLLLRFFSRLRRSEDLLTRLRDGQESLLDKLSANAELERELVHSFQTRQAELRLLNEKLEERAARLSTLVEQAEAISRSPQFLREVIIAGKKKGRTSVQLSKATGLSLDEVELILQQAEK